MVEGGVEGAPLSLELTGVKGGVLVATGVGLFMMIVVDVGRARGSKESSGVELEDLDGLFLKAVDWKEGGVITRAGFMGMVCATTLRTYASMAV
jgi:hypothetical protein